MGRCQNFGLGVRWQLQGQEVCNLMHNLCYKTFLATQPEPFPCGADRLNHIFISCPLRIRGLPAIGRAHCQITATRVR